jgi:hypothetical protein
MTSLIENLSAAAAEVMALHADSAYTQLVPGRGTDGARALLEELTPQNVLARAPQSPADASCVLSALWLWHDFLNESHTISQSIATPTGSYWHAIMHRREGDFWNSKYWLNKCRGHPALAKISVAAVDVVNASREARAIHPMMQGDFDAGALVDLVEAIHASPDDPRRPLVVEVQKIEWRVLVECSVQR